MFLGLEAAQGKADRVLQELIDHTITKTHSRHLHVEHAKAIGLNVATLEDDFDDEFQDLVLTIHHCFMHAFTQSTAIKIIENHMGQRMVLHVKQVMQPVPLNIQQMAPADG